MKLTLTLFIIAFAMAGCSANRDENIEAQKQAPFTKTVQQRKPAKESVPMVVLQFRGCKAHR
jgi:uncharacterized protein YcfL